MALRFPEAVLAQQDDSRLFQKTECAEGDARGPCAGNRRLMEDLCSSLGWTPPQVIEVESQSVALELVSRGLGWYISQPLCLYPARSLFSKLRILAFEDTHAARDLYLISLRGHESPGLPLVRNFICNWLAVEMPKAFANTAVADRIRESVNEL